MRVTRGLTEFEPSAARRALFSSPFFASRTPTTEHSAVDGYSPPGINNSRASCLPPYYIRSARARLYRRKRYNRATVLICTSDVIFNDNNILSMPGLNDWVLGPVDGTRCVCTVREKPYFSIGRQVHGRGGSVSGT